jgi:hypothetical protein
MGTARPSNLSQSRIQQTGVRCGISCNMKILTQYVAKKKNRHNRLNMVFQKPAKAKRVPICIMTHELSEGSLI